MVTWDHGLLRVGGYPFMTTELRGQGIMLKATRGLIAGAPGWRMITDLMNGPPGTKALTWTRAGWLQTGSYAECSMADADTTFVFEELEEQVDAALDALAAFK